MPSILQALFQRRDRAASVSPKTAEASPEADVTFLQKFGGFSEEFKGAFVKQAEAFGMPRRQTYDAFSFLDKSMVCEKRGSYIHWLQTIHQTN